MIRRHAELFRADSIAPPVVVEAGQKSGFTRLMKFGQAADR
jgi:hypothetical protein